MSALLASGLLLGTTGAQAGFIKVSNGDFEDIASEAVPAPGGFTELGAGSTDLLGWVVGGASIDIHDTGHTNAHSGRYSVDLAGSGQPGSITQTLQTQAGVPYVVTFWYGGHPYHPYPGPAKMQFSWGGEMQRELSVEASADPQAIDWQYAAYILRATSDLTELTFYGRSPNGGMLLDDVRVFPVPEPDSYALMAAGFVGLAACRWRRRH